MRLGLEGRVRVRVRVENELKGRVRVVAGSKMIVFACTGWNRSPYLLVHFSDFSLTA